MGQPGRIMNMLLFHQEQPNVPDLKGMEGNSGRSSFL